MREYESCRRIHLFLFCECGHIGLPTGTFTVGPSQSFVHTFLSNSAIIGTTFVHEHFLKIWSAAVLPIFIARRPRV